jgi:hypothetical protein
MNAALEIDQLVAVILGGQVPAGSGLAHALLPRRLVDWTVQHFVDFKEAFRSVTGVSSFLIVGHEWYTSPHAVPPQAMKSNE